MIYKNNSRKHYSFCVEGKDSGKGGIGRRVTCHVPVDSPSVWKLHLAVPEGQIALVRDTFREEREGLGRAELMGQQPSCTWHFWIQKRKSQSFNSKMPKYEAVILARIVPHKAMVRTLFFLSNWKFSWEKALDSNPVNNRHPTRGSSSKWPHMSSTRAGSSASSKTLAKTSSSPTGWTSIRTSVRRPPFTPWRLTVARKSCRHWNSSSRMTRTSLEPRLWN